MKQTKRNLKAEWAPSVTREGDRIKLFHAIYAGNTRYEIRGDLSTSSATTLVAQLKRFIREIHALERGQIEQQEKTLSG